MKEQSLKKQAALTAAAGVLVRGMGLGLRLGVSRLLGAEALGIMELAGSAQMLALTPAAAGLPGAVSRLTARAGSGEERQRVLYAGRQEALRLTIGLLPVFLLLSPFLARWLGDGRTWPSLVLFSPALVLIGVSGVYDGACFGAGNAWPPALSDLCEQGTRLLVTGALLGMTKGLAPAWRAAMPAAATTAAEAVGLGVILAKVGQLEKRGVAREEKALRREIRRLALPLMLNRLCHTGLRALCASMIPQRLMAGGLEQREAMSQLGMLNGMVMPLMFLPGLLAGALATVGGPAAAKCRGRRGERRLILRLCLPALGAGCACCAGLHALAPWLAARLYRLPEVAPLIRFLCPLAVILPLQQVLSGVMTGLGMQKKALMDSVLGAALTLGLTWRLAALPGGGILGAGLAALAGHGLTLLCTGIHFLCRKDEK